MIFAVPRADDRTNLPPDPRFPRMVPENPNASWRTIIQAQVFDPNYSIIKTHATDVLDHMAESPHRTVRELGRILDKITPDDWANWFS
jgi:hypothetical protein